MASLRLHNYGATNLGGGLGSYGSKRPAASNIKFSVLRSKLEKGAPIPSGAGTQQQGGISGGGAGIPSQLYITHLPGKEHLSNFYVAGGGAGGGKTAESRA